MSGEFSDGCFPSHAGAGRFPTACKDSGDSGRTSRLRRRASLALYAGQMHWIAEALLYFFVLSAVLLSLVAIFTAHGIG